VKLSQLFQQVFEHDHDVALSQIKTDCRLVEPGDVFICLTPNAENAKRYSSHAINRGALCVMADPKQALEKQSAIIECPGLIEQAADIACRLYDDPSQKLKVLGVTGTNGKTSVCHLLAQALTHLGKKSAVLGTAGNGIWPDLIESPLTTLGVFELQAKLAEYVDAGVDYVAMEVSSHGLVQGRVRGVQFAVGIFTNLSRDHLDFHGTMQAYANAKRSFFDCPMQLAVINVDDEIGHEWIEAWPKNGPRLLRYGLDREADAKLSLQNLATLPQRFEFEGCTQRFASRTLLIGRFNLYNLLSVITALVSLGFEGETLSELIPSLKPPLGRMQVFQVEGKPLAVVDYAHTPEALSSVLTALREFTQGRLYCVFGCGGDRDAGKRPLMGAIAQKQADVVILTNDNPRGESPEAIVSDILAGFSGLKPSVMLDRREAIAFALHEAKAGDIVLIAGKGHENYQIIGDARYAFSDAACVSAALEG